MTTARIDVGVLAAVAKWTLDPGASAHLRWVVIRKREIVASDGHRVVRVPLPTSVAGKFAVALESADVARMVAIARAVDSPDVDLEVTAEAVIASPATCSGVTACYQNQDIQQYPSAKAIDNLAIPGNKLPVITLDPKYLAAIHDVESALNAAAVRHRRSTFVGVSITGASDSLSCLEFTSGHGARYLIAPMRGFSEGS